MKVRKYGLYLAWLIASLQTIGSLYFSTMRHYDPCHLCWYQRICLFPLVIILGIATHRSFFDISRYVLPQVVLGFLFALYQTLIQEIPYLNLIDVCGGGQSCSDKIYIGIGHITIPMISAFGFFLIALFLWVSHPYKQRKRV